VNQSKSYRVAVVWRGDRQARAEARPGSSRLFPVLNEAPDALAAATLQRLSSRMTATSAALASAHDR
jgi:hypothetical protein